MAKADVLDLVEDFGVNGVNEDEIDVFYDEIIRELGAFEVLVGTELVSVLSGQAEYMVSGENVKVFEIHHSTRGRLDMVSEQGLRAALGASWMSRTGTPIAATMDQQGGESFRLVPVPNQDATLTMLVSERKDDVPKWLELIIALQILHREYARESDHQDIQLAQAALALSSILGFFGGLEMPHGREERTVSR